ncbi:hypothetical protein [Nostoc sp. 'Peltigera membranacea cyanobiont' 232]|uniref:hypothetical protein n=1 Tax=Nostoc sp. 'Peltigera membranacea cyanobiont' 232 TaxID=2014531 RepID=UPI000B954039|nr:hypothetical protein [Nostoc sp. 'Peltigera membranacea cyanobiont' 232]OYD99790.1 hypothetical protein CDG79_38880 [Nostoc sp. 'Peltigera membranacea cyanobiont' 232]
MDYLFEQGTFTDKHQAIKNFDAFRQSVEDMAKLGLLSPSVNTLDLGDLRRRFPICPVFLDFGQKEVIREYESRT